MWHCKCEIGPPSWHVVSVNPVWSITVTWGSKTICPEMHTVYGSSKIMATNNNKQVEGIFNSSFVENKHSKKQVPCEWIKIQQHICNQLLWHVLMAYFAHIFTFSSFLLQVSWHNLFFCDNNEKTCQGQCIYTTPQKMWMWAFNLYVLEEKLKKNKHFSHFFFY